MKYDLAKLMNKNLNEIRKEAIVFALPWLPAVGVSVTALYVIIGMIGTLLTYQLLQYLYKHYGTDLTLDIINSEAEILKRILDDGAEYKFDEGKVVRLPDPKITKSPDPVPDLKMPRVPAGLESLVEDEKDDNCLEMFALAYSRYGEEKSENRRRIRSPSIASEEIVWAIGYGDCLDGRAILDDLRSSKDYEDLDDKINDYIFVSNDLEMSSRDELYASSLCDKARQAGKDCVRVCILSDFENFGSSLAFKYSDNPFSMEEFSPASGSKYKGTLIHSIIDVYEAKEMRYMQIDDCNNPTFRYMDSSIIKLPFK